MVAELCQRVANDKQSGEDTAKKKKKKKRAPRGSSGLNTDRLQFLLGGFGQFRQIQTAAGDNNSG